MQSGAIRIGRGIDSTQPRAMLRNLPGPVRWGVIAAMAAVAATWLTYETYRLFWRPERIAGIPIHPGAIDLGIFHSVVTTWFSGASVFTGATARDAVYPPASMLLMRPVYGWDSLATSTVVWSITFFVAAAWLLRIVVRESGAARPAARAFAGLLPLAIYPTGAVLGNGQMTLHVLTLLLGGLLLLRDGSRTWSRDLLAALLILFALAKPTISAPFFWIVIFAARSLRPAIIVGAGYAAVTLWAASFQEYALGELVRRLAAQASVLGTHAGESNLHSLLAFLGWHEWIGMASVAMLALLGVWTWRHRHADYWLLMGVAALAARFWSYHRWYDDLLILVPMVTLYRLATGGPSHRAIDAAAAYLFAATLLVMLAPGGRYLLPAPWDAIAAGIQVTIWMVDFAFLLIVARREVTRAPDAGFAA
jgi:hypothetical protein